jgi:hypothetical protein
MREFRRPAAPALSPAQAAGGGERFERARLCAVLSHYWKFDAGSFASLKSRRGDGFVPCLHRRGPEGSVRCCRDEVALGIECIVERGVDF